MKEGWEYKKLGECFISINNGANIKQIKGAKGIPITRIETLSNDKFNRGRMGYADILDASPYSSYILNDGDILMSHINSMKYLGRAVQYLKNEDETIIHGMNLLRLVPTKDVLSSFLIYQFYTTFFRSQIVSISHQSVNQASFNTTNLKNLEIKVPPLPEQQRIVDYLDAAFAKIDAMKANAEKSLNEAKALFQASLKEMLEPKEGWEEKKLGDVGTFIRGGNFSKKDFVEDGYPCIHYGQIHTKFGVATFEHLSCVPETMVKKERCASKGDLVIAITSEDDEGSCKCTAWMADYDAYVGGHTAIFKHNLNPIYVSYYFKTARFQKDKLDYTHGFKVVEISPKDIAKIPIFYPSAEEQQSIVETLDSLKSKVDRLQSNFDKISQECDALKQAILRQVFE